MTKPLLIVSIILSLGAAVLGYMNRDKMVAARTQLADVESQLQARTQELGATKKEAEGKNQQITALTGEKEKLAGERDAAKGELTKAKEEATAAQQKATAAETELAQVKTDAQAKDTRIAELEQQVAAGTKPGDTEAPAPELAEVQARVTELETINAQLQDQNTGLAAQMAELQRKEKTRQEGVMRPGVSGTILAVNQAWNFVVLSLGDRQGVVPNAEMLVQRGNQFLGKVRVTSVEPSTSVADILVRTVPRGLSVMPGDRVIYQAQRD
ncbi:MAG: hypothetical protein FGM15_03715 [Chthoniobacterales bacterium]|nr:hypothetical protein [Chthoniobacterales bacterium]